MNDPLHSSDEALNRQSRRIDLAHHGDFALGPVAVEPSLRKLKGPLGETMLEPKVMQVLAALADPIGNINSRDDLIERCWDGRIVGDTSINRVISLLRSALSEVAGDDVRVENVPKVGYRLLVSGTPDTPAIEPAAADQDVPVAPALARHRKSLFALGALAMALLIGALLWLRPGANDPIETVRLAMLPLEFDQGVDPIYASGLEGELRGSFARATALEVTSSESAKILSERGLSPQEIGAKLGAQFVWTGSFSTDVESSSLSFRLINVETEQELFSDTLKSGAQATEHIPFRTARSVATAMNRPLRESEGQSEISSGDFRLYLLAGGLLKTRGMDQRRAAVEILEQVTVRNPGFAGGWGALSKAYFLLPDIEPDERARNLDRATQAAERALSIDPDEVEALKILGISSDEAEPGLGRLQRAVELDPGDSEAWFWLGINQERFILDGGHPLSSARRMLEIDPLWPASWLGSARAANFGDLEQAYDMEQTVLAASVTPSQRLFAEARLAQFDGDLSGFLQLAQRATRSSTEGERIWSTSTQDRSIRILLGLSQMEGAILQRGKAPAAVMNQIDLEQLPSRDLLRDHGLTGSGAWDDLHFVAGALPLYLQSGRHAELLADYDARFADHAAYLAFAEQNGRPERVIPDISTYLVLAMRREGRDDEADEHLASLEKVILRWRAANIDWIDWTIIELEYAALTEDHETAIQLVEELPKFGWPYLYSRVDPTGINLLRQDPLFDTVRQLPQVRAITDPIRAKLAKERLEIETQEL